MTTRYIVNDVEAAIEFYTGLLGFDLKQPGLVLKRYGLRTQARLPTGPLGFEAHLDLGGFTGREDFLLQGRGGAAASRLHLLDHQ